MTEARLIPMLALAASLALPGPARGGEVVGGGFLRHYYWVDETSSREALEKRAAAIDVLSPQWFWVEEDGRIEGAADPELLAIADAQGLTLMPLVANRGFRADVARSVLHDEATADALVAALAMSCLAHGFAGLQVDFEGLAPDSRAPYARFVEALAAELHRHDLLLSVAVGAPLDARPDADADGWPPSGHAASIDYRRIAAAADWVTLMTYDQHWGDPGPVAGLPWIEANVRRSLGWIPAEKLVLGVPLYFRRWSGDAISEGTHAEATALAAATGATVELDPVEQENVFRFDRDGVANVVWFQDAETLRRRVALARRLRLRGFSAWRLGHEDPAAWQAGPFGRASRGAP